MPNDQQNERPILPLAGQTQPLPTQSVAHFALSVTVSEFMIALGQSHVLIEPTPAGAAGNLVQEWVLGLSLSPPAAIQLFKALEAGIKNYESQFGKIPEDPKARLSAENIKVRNP